MKKVLPAFTLIEVLVVVALTASLMAMLFPVFSAARGRARQTTCISNLRQIGSAMALYAQDFDDLYPYGADPIDKYTNDWGVNPTNDPILKSMPFLQDVLFPYVKTRAVWQCASDTGFDALEDNPDPTTGEPIQLKAHPTAFATFGTSYAYRTELAFRQKLFATGGYAKGQKVGPAEMAILTELTGKWHGGGKMSSYVYTALMGDGRVVRQNLRQNSDAWAVQLDRGP